jgi:hypothetical protein
MQFWVKRLQKRLKGKGELSVFVLGRGWRNPGSGSPVPQGAHRVMSGLISSCLTTTFGGHCVVGENQKVGKERA